MINSTDSFSLKQSLITVNPFSTHPAAPDGVVRQLLRRRRQGRSRAVPLTHVDLRPMEPSFPAVAAARLLEGEVGVGRDPADVGPRRRRSTSAGGVAVAAAAAATGAARVLAAVGQPHFRLARCSCRRGHGRRLLRRPKALLHY